MNLKFLIDNNAIIDQYYLGEPAVSYYIEDGDNKILFDTGYCVNKKCRKNEYRFK